MPTTVNFLHTNLRLSHKSELLAAIQTARPASAVQVATVNPEFMVETRNNPAFRSALEAMTHCIVDGSGLFFMLRLWLSRAKIKTELYHGADLVADLLSAYQDGSKSFYLLGGPVGQAQAAQASLEQQYPRIAIVGAEDGGMVSATDPQLDQGVVSRIQSARPDILLVGFGAPKQELWIRLAADTPLAPVMIGVGGTFGFYTSKKRAPQWLRVIHMEWLSRMVQEPGHWKRVWRAIVTFSLMSLWWMLGNWNKRPR